MIQRPNIKMIYKTFLVTLILTTSSKFDKISKELKLMTPRKYVS